MQTFKSFLNLFLQSSCPLCQRPAEGELCKYCHRHLQNSELDNPSQLWYGELPIFAWGAYGGILKRAIAALKYENQPQLSRPLGHWLGKAWIASIASNGTKNLTVLPIPLHPTRRKQRGFNQAELLAKSFCEYTGLPMQPAGLERVRDTKAQFGLSPSEREQNLADAFRLGKGFHGHRHPVLLLDDIYTSGATARAAAKTLRQQGIRVYGLVAVATPPKPKSRETSFPLPNHQDDA